MVTKSKMFCPTHKMLKTRWVENASGEMTKMCALCERELAPPKRKREEEVVDEARRERMERHYAVFYRDIDTFIRGHQGMSNSKIADEMRVDPRTVAKRREAVGLGASTAGKLSRDIAIMVLELKRNEPNITMLELARRAGCSRGGAENVLANPRRYISDEEEDELL